MDAANTAMAHRLLIRDFMKRQFLRGAAALLSGALAVSLTTSANARAVVDERLARAQKPVLDAFMDRVKEYRKLREQAEAKTGPLPESANPAAITKRQHLLGQAIIDSRPTARRGDIFTPRAAAEIRRLIARDLAARRPVERQAFLVSQPRIDVRVNEFYPSSVPLATVPPQLLRILPQLPDGLEYRFVNGDLILHDVDPNLVVDVLPDAVPARYRKQ